MTFEIDMNWVVVGSLLLMLALSMPLALADTGTYTINSEIAELIIHPNGDVDIIYTIDIQCDSGNIPWVTVGMPTTNYEIVSWGGSASSVRPDNKMGWSGVYVELSETLLAGQHSEFTFKATQHDFVYLYDGNATVQFTPSWWNNAVTKFLAVHMEVSNETNVTSVLTSVQPTVFKEGSVIWEWADVGRGVKKTVGMRMPVDAFTNLAESPDGVLGMDDAVMDSVSVVVVTLAVVGIVLVIFYLSFASIIRPRRSYKPYKSPTISLGTTTSSHSFKHKVRNINMKCPRDGTSISRKDVKGVTVNVCHACGGAWFDKGEIESLIKKDAKERDWLLPSLLADTTRVGWSVPDVCPRCESFDFKKKEQDDMIIYGCAGSCSGIWLDRGMFDKIKKRRQEQEKDYDRDDDDLLLTWFLFYPWIMSTGRSSSHAIRTLGGGSSGGAGSSGSTGGGSSCACVSCACVAACACACACAGGGAVGCSPKDTIDCHQINIGGEHVVKD